MSAHATAEPSVPQPALVPGTVVGGRFEVESLAGQDALGQVYAARDQKTRKPVAIHLLGRAIASDAMLTEAVRDAARHGASLKHKSLTTVYGVGTHDGQPFVAREWLQGRSAAALIAERRTQGRTLSVRGVYNLIAHVCKALAAYDAHGCHGALRPSIVYVTKSGRVKLGDLDVGPALVKAQRFELLPSAEQAFLAPEVKARGAIDARVDVFGVGALLYALLTARSPLDAFVIPSQVRPDATPELDAVMMRCLALDPAQRFASADQVIKALLPLVSSAPEPPPDDFEVDVEIDVDIAASLAPPAPRSESSASLLPIAIVQESEPPPPPPPMAAQAPRAPVAPKAPQPAPSAAAAHDDLAELTARLTKNDSARWMAIKNGMDHGPFTARELIKLIVDGEVLEQHVLFNMAGNQRKPLAEYSEFAPFVQQYRIRRDEKEHAEALVRSSQVEKRSTAAKFVVLSVSIGAIALGFGTYWASRQAGRESERSDADLAALYESGQVKISGTAGILQHTARPGGARRAPSSGGGTSSGTGFSSYEDAMNQAMELGDATKGGGERQLTSADVAGVMNRELNRMFGCVGEELRRGRKLGRVVIDLAILGSGHVAGASVGAGSAGFQKCIVTKLREVRFPNFPAPRMGARYSFNVD